MRPDVRTSLNGFLKERPGPLGVVALADRDTADRLFRLHWPRPEQFARAILLERMRDLGEGVALDVIRTVEAAPAMAATDDVDRLETERTALLARLDPLHYFMDRAGFEAALADADGWLRRHEVAFAAFHRRTYRAAVQVLVELVPVLSVAAALEAYNRQGRPVGEASRVRFIEETEVLRQLVAQGGPQSEELVPVLVRAAQVLNCVRLSAAAVVAAMDVHRRREHVSHARD